jgi:serine protease Do
VTPLAARRGVFETPYDGPVYVLDAMTNNAGAAGGALTDYQGRLAGVLGKELRSSQSNIWLNYAIPIDELRPAVADIMAGKARSRADTQARRPADPLTLAKLGIVLLPPVLAKTPPYVESIVSGSPADAAGIRADDLIVMVDGSLMQGIRDVIDELSFIDELDPVRLTILRDVQLIEVELAARP